MNQIDELQKEKEELHKRMEEKEEMEEVLAQENFSMEEKLQDITLQHESCQRSLQDYEKKVQFLLQELETRNSSAVPATDNKQVDALRLALANAEGRESSLRKEHQELVANLQKVHYLLHSYACTLI